MAQVHLSAFQDRIVHFTFGADPKVLEPYVPKGMELLLQDGKASLGISASLISEVMYKGIRVSGEDVIGRIGIHFYVKWATSPERKASTGIFLLDELFPRKRNVFVSKLLLKGEPRAVRMDHDHHFGQDGLISQYRWEANGRWNTIKVGASKDMEGVEEEEVKELLQPDFLLQQRKGKIRKSRLSYSELKVHPVFDHQLRIDPEAIPIPNESWDQGQASSAHSLEGLSTSISKPHPLS